MNEGTVFTVFIFPRPWPPPETVTIFSKIDGGSGFKVLVDHKARFVFEVHSSDEVVAQHIFQSICLVGSGRAILSVSWNETEASLRINSKDVMLDNDANGEILVLVTKDDPIPGNELIYRDINPEKSKTDEEFLFLSVVKDIDKKVYDGDRYSLIKAAGLLRQFFIDSSPLFHIVNRNHRLKILFETTDTQRKLPVKPNVHWIDLDGSKFKVTFRIAHNLDSFLNSPCLEMDDVVISVKDIIRSCANVKGGVHIGKAKSLEERTVIDWDRIFELVGDEPSLKTLRSICLVSLKALKSLVDEIQISA